MLSFIIIIKLQSSEVSCITLLNKIQRNGHYWCIHIIYEETSLEQIVCYDTGSDLQG